MERDNLRTILAQMDSVATVLFKQNDLYFSTLQSLQEDVVVLKEALEGNESEVARLAVILLEQMNTKIEQVIR